jgi:hypothetical protein
VSAWTFDVGDDGSLYPRRHGHDREHQEPARPAVRAAQESANKNGVTFRYKDYRIEGPARYKTMTLATGEFIRRFLMHVLPQGFHRIC